MAEQCRLLIVQLFDSVDHISSTMPSNEVILTAHCQDRAGLVATISDWIFQHGGNIFHLDQHVDAGTQRFFIRVQWSLDQFDLDRSALVPIFESDIAEPLRLDYRLSYTDEVPRMAIFVTKLSHCIWDLLSRQESGELKVDIPLIISNHGQFRGLAERFGIPYHVFDITRENKADQEVRELELLAEHGIDFIVLARYMQILSDEFVKHYPNRIINIHHSFLPAFAGARPYHRAHDRGVKVIGATAHYVTADLDEGPIIEQDTIRVSHRDAVTDLVRRGRDLEKVVLARAVRLHVNRQVLVYGGRTLVFD